MIYRDAINPKRCWVLFVSTRHAGVTVEPTFNLLTGEIKHCHDERYNNSHQWALPRNWYWVRI